MHLQVESLFVPDIIGWMSPSGGADDDHPDPTDDRRFGPQPSSWFEGVGKTDILTRSIEGGMVTFERLY
jgi:hypothetical protein